MPTPVIYHNSTIDPFAHLTAVQKNTRTEVFYATNRVAESSVNKIYYNNTLDSKLHFGKATIGMGGPDVSWQKLRISSLSSVETEPVPLNVEKVVELARAPIGTTQSPRTLPAELQAFVDSINLELANAIDKEIMVYVHGTKVDFANSIILTAEIDHFAGRDFVGVAFAWPSHQNILSYLFGTDVQQALNSSPALQSLITLLVQHTIAEHINILAYSAGGKVASKALSELYLASPDFSQKELKEQLRLGSVIFAAADVEVDVFLDRMLHISKLADQVVITVTDDDNALRAAKNYMGGTFRAGSANAENTEKQFIANNKLKNVEIVDVSIGKNKRGFDIVGHHYWYRHPWMSSEIIFLLRTGLPPSRRGLSSTEQEQIWYLSPEYPAKVQKAADTELKGQW